MPIPAEQIDPDARKVIKRLVRYEFEAYLVGGCVRDLLLERSPKDFDIATSATPNEVKSLFRNCRIIGRRFRLAHIFFGSKIIETATFRSNPREAELEGEEEPASDLLIRRDNVFGNAEEDARRRDFTINGLFYDIEADQVIDYVGGLNDLAGRTVRTIGEPDIRFREDPVRILRAIKFAARLDFDIEPASLQAILVHQVEIPKCAPPRVLEEIYRLLRGGAARRSVELLCDTGVGAILLPEVAALLRDRPDSEAARHLWRLLDRIDATKDRQPSNAVLLCALAGPLIGPQLLDDADARAREVTTLVDEHTRRLLVDMRASRRDAERARQILLTLRRIGPSKKRRGRAVTLVRREWFEEALQVYELLTHAMRPGQAVDEELEGWRRAIEESGRDGTGPAVEGETPRRRRRRRGGRRAQGEGEAALADIDGDVELDDEAVPFVALQHEGPAHDNGSPPRDNGSPPRDNGSPARDHGEPASVAPAPQHDLAVVDQTSAAPPSTGSTTPVR